MSTSSMAAAGQLANDVIDERLGVAKEHKRFAKIVERIVDAGKAWAHAAFDDHDGAGLVHVENGHAEDGAGGIGAGGGIGDVVGANHQGNIGLGKLAVDVVHLNQ